MFLLTNFGGEEDRNPRVDTGSAPQRGPQRGAQWRRKRNTDTQMVWAEKHSRERAKRKKEGLDTAFGELWVFISHLRGPRDLSPCSASYPHTAHWSSQYFNLWMTWAMASISQVCWAPTELSKYQEYCIYCEIDS